jgi:hypothetical protein
MYKAGTTTEIITPAESLWLAGYAARTEPAKGKISDLHATAVALEDEQGGRLVIASVDLIAVTKAIADPVAAAVEKEIGLPRERLILAATHTHYGPEYRDDKALFFNIPPDYAAKFADVRRLVIDKLTEVIIASTKNMVPVRLYARKATATFAHNRRREGVKGGTPSPLDILDHDVPILDVVHTETGLRKAIIFGYACHNTTLPPEDCRYSADWAGVAKQHLQQHHAGSTALFITGCGADQNPEPRGTVELSNRYGQELAVAVELALTKDDAIEITGPIRAARQDIPLELQPVTRDTLDAMLQENDPPKQRKAKFLLDQLNRGDKLITHYDAPIQAINIGDRLLMIVMSGEPVVDWALKFKRQYSKIPFLWIAGYCNDMYGYVPTKRIQQEGGYEGGRANLWSWVPSPFTDDLETRISHAIQTLVRRLS